MEIGGGGGGGGGVMRSAELARRGEAEAKKNERRRTLRLRGGNAGSQGSVAQGESLSEEQGDAFTYLNVSSRETKTTPVNPRNRCAARCRFTTRSPSTTPVSPSSPLWTKSWKRKENYEDVKTRIGDARVEMILMHLLIECRHRW